MTHVSFGLFSKDFPILELNTCTTCQNNHLPFLEKY
jgi:hypothetical protein